MAKARSRRPRLLTPVGLTEDGFGILLAGAPGGDPSHVVRIDSGLVAHLEEARARLPVDANGDSSLSPREIQVLLRRGESVESVARRAGVPPAWVARFEGPIAWERAGMVQRARRAVLHRPRLGASALPVGEAVRARVPLDDERFDAAWDAVRSGEADDEWIVSFTYTARGARRTARWGYRPRRDEVRALDKHASDLAWVPEMPTREDRPVKEAARPTSRDRARRSRSGTARRPTRRSGG